MIMLAMVDLERAVNEESWEYLRDNLPGLAAALEVEVKRGATADDIRRWAMRYTRREGLALRLQQAAGFLRSGVE